MVDGREQIEVQTGSAGLQACVAVDLDGTLLRGNSLHMMLRFMAGKLRREHRFSSLLRLLGLLGLRRLRLISHVAMKRPLHAMALRELSEGDVRRLSELMVRSVNRGLVERLEVYRRRGFRLLLATAAPDIWPRLLAEELGFDAVVATPLPGRNEEYLEARGERKLQLCRECAGRHGWEIRAVATDHSDDLPLLGLAGVERLLVDPAPALIGELRRRGLDFTVVR